MSRRSFRYGTWTRRFAPCRVARGARHGPQVGPGGQLFHVVVYWPELDEPLHAEIVARDREGAELQLLATFGMSPGREPIERIEAWTLDQRLTRDA